MHGTGDLFRNFLDHLPPGVIADAISFPTREPLGYEDLVKVVQKRMGEFEPYVLIGESFSGPLAVKLAAERPKDLRGLVLCATFLKSPLASHWKWLIRMAGPVLFRVRPPAGIVRRYLAGKDAPKELVGRFRDAFGSVDHRTLLRRAEAVFSVDVREAFRKVQVPVLYLRATKDRIVDERSVREILAIRN